MFLAALVHLTGWSRLEYQGSNFRSAKRAVSFSLFVTASSILPPSLLSPRTHSLSTRIYRLLHAGPSICLYPVSNIEFTNYFFPDRTAKTVGITQGPPDYVPLQDFER